MLKSYGLFKGHSTQLQGLKDGGVEEIYKMDSRKIYRENS